jgi:hypothetical protein
MSEPTELFLYTIGNDCVLCGPKFGGLIRRTTVLNGGWPVRNLEIAVLGRGEERIRSR